MSTTQTIVIVLLSWFCGIPIVVAILAWLFDPWKKRE